MDQEPESSEDTAGFLTDPEYWKTYELDHSTALMRRTVIGNDPTAPISSAKGEIRYELRLLM
jgi:hypothetical protein